MALGRIRKRHHQWMVAQHLLHARPLHADAAPVNQPHVAQSRLMRRQQVLVHDRRDISRRKCVEVEDVLDADTMGI